MQLNYKVYGKGEPLIILHGLLGSLDNWQSVAKKLANKYQVFIVDQRNHGKSPHTDEHNYELMQKDLLQFMDDHELNEANIIGHSMGGKTAMFFALKNPEMVKRLIVVDMAPKAYPRGHDEIFKALLKIPVNEISSREEAEEILKKDISIRAIRLFLLKNLDRIDNDNFRWKMNLKTLWENYDEITVAVPEGEFSKPTLFLKGENSPYIGDEDEQSIQEQFPKAAIKAVPNAGHWVHADSPRAFMENIFDFISNS